MSHGKRVGYDIGRTGLVGIVGLRPACGGGQDLAEAYRKATGDPKVAKALEGVHYPARF